MIKAKNKTPRRSKKKSSKGNSVTSRIRHNNRFPEIEVSRQRGYYTQFGYKSDTIANREGRTAVNAAGHKHQENRRERLIGQSRDFLRNNGIYRGMIERSVSYIVANGFKLSMQTENEKYNKQVEKLWKKFWKRPEIRGILSGRRVEKMVCREILVAGDTGVIKTEERKLQLIEAEQIKGKNNREQGIETDSNGKPKKFLISPYGRGGRVQTSKAEPIDEQDFLFITNPDRPSAIRSVPPCQATFPMLHRINDVVDAEAIAMQMLSRIALSFNRKGGGFLGYEESRDDTDKTGDDKDGDLATRISELDYALIFHGEPGDEIKGVDRNIPGKNFTETLTMFLRLLGLPLGIPLEVILLDWTKSNYSQSRAVLEQAYQSFLGWQLLLEDFFHIPTFEWALGLAIAKEEIRPPRSVSDPLAHEWIKPTFPWVDQLKEAQAYGLKLDRSLTTHDQVLKTLNLDRTDILPARKREIIEAIKTAQDIEKQTKVLPPWETFAGLDPNPKGSTNNGSQDKDDDEQDADGEDEDKL